MGEKATHSRLRRLALDYAEGRISRNRYVRERTRFLDALTRGQEADVATEERETPRAETSAKLEPEDPPTIRQGIPSGPGTRNIRAIAAAVGVLAVLLVVLSVLLFARKTPDRPGRGLGAAEESRLPHANAADFDTR